MRIDPQKTKISENNYAKNIEKAAILFAFVGVFIWFFKIIFF